MLRVDDEALLQQAALQVVIELLFDERGEQATLGVESFDKPGVAGRDDPVKRGLFRAGDLSYEANLRAL